MAQPSSTRQDPARSDEPVDPRGPDVPVPSPRAAARILLAQVDPILVDLLDRGLRVAGHQPSTAESRKEVLAQPPGVYDLLLLDTGWHEPGGLHLCQRLHAQHPTTPLLLIGDHADQVDAAVAATFGASDYLAKPFRLATLLTRIQTLIRPPGARAV